MIMNRCVTSALACLPLVTSCLGYALGSSATTGPLIYRGPASQTVLAGGNVTLTVEVTAGEPAFISWAANGLTLVGATSSTFTLTNVTPANSGTYAVTVWNTTVT